MGLLERAELYREFADVLDSQDIYDICMWGVNPQVLEYPTKSKPFDEDEFIRKAEENAHNLFNRTEKVLS